ncbi:hypothetical protein NHQ30_011318 [Ciborinia camelliae]|nr:hypothetical protein NHQ30_011318 [Ciborinia camelliae]
MILTVLALIMIALNIQKLEEKAISTIRSPEQRLDSDPNSGFIYRTGELAAAVLKYNKEKNVDITKDLKTMGKLKREAEKATLGLPPNDRNPLPPNAHWFTKGLRNHTELELERGEEYELEKKRKGHVFGGDRAANRIEKEQSEAKSLHGSGPAERHRSNLPLYTSSLMGAGPQTPILAALDCILLERYPIIEVPANPVKNFFLSESLKSVIGELKSDTLGSTLMRAISNGKLEGFPTPPAPPAPPATPATPATPESKPSNSPRDPVTGVDLSGHMGIRLA